MILDGGYVDGFRSLHSDRAGQTFPAWDPHVRLDFVFVPRRIAGLLTSCEVVDVPGVREASDHLPLLSVLDVPDEPARASAASALAEASVAGLRDLEPTP